MSQVRKSLILQLLDSYIGLMLQIASTAVIARLLTPNEIGIFSVAAVLVAMASQFRDFGLGEYLIQERDLTASKIRAAFAANIIVSWLMAVVLFGSSWAVGDFYGQAGVGDVMRLQALNFVIVPFGAVTMAIFRRDLNYKPMFVAGLCANILSFGVAVGGAVAGLSYMSLAWSSLVGLLVTVGVSIVYRPAQLPWWPSIKGIKQVIDFSKHAMGIYFFGQIGKSAPEAVIGRVLDMASVAFFSRANGLMEIFNRTVLKAVLPVCLPFFAQSARAGQSTVPGYLSATVLLTGVGWPFFAVVGVLSFSVVRLLYGPQWEVAVNLAQILCLAAIIELPYWLTKEVMIASARVDRANLLQLTTQGFRLVGLALVIPFGLKGACWGLVLGSAAGAWMSQHELGKVIGLRFADLVRACRSSVIVSLAAAMPVLGAGLIAPQSADNFLWHLAVGGAASTVAWLVALAATAHPFWEEVRHVARTVGERLQRHASNG